MTKAPIPPVSAWATLQAEGWDLSLLESNLRKTPLERIRAHDRALTAALSLRKAMEQANARTRIAS
jgi:hypothetical protein